MQVGKLRGAIATNGIKKKELADKFGISVQALNKKLNGKTKITTDDATKFCEILGITNDIEKCNIFLT